MLYSIFCFILIGATVSLTTYHREPLWHSQWHLHDTKEIGEYWMKTGQATDHLAIQTVWNEFNFTGRGVRLAIVDDGVDISHTEFSDSYDKLLAYDYNDNDSNPSPRVHDSHGTQSAGVATGHANSVCGLGTAPNSILVPIRLIASPTTDLVEANGLSHHADVVDIYCNSWGPPDDGMHLDGPGPVTAAAMQHVVDTGRGGKGGIYVWAAGNGRQWLDMCSYDGFANSRLVIAVAAVDYFGQLTYYGEWCPAVLVSAPSSSGSGPTDKQHIATTQPHGRYGESDGDCCTDFGGTSAAAPMVAGIVALMLEARPELGWRDVQHILALSARRNDAKHISWSKNGAGLWYSPAYGFGVVNATAAVLMSMEWELLPPTHYIVRSTPENTFVSLEDRVFSTSSQFDFVVEDILNATVEFVDLYVTIEHARRGDIEILLFSPSGMRNEIALPHNDDASNYDRWRFGLRSVLGERSPGTWTVAIRDVIPNGHTGIVLEVELKLWLH